ncbi:MAG: hypothetical protein HQL98_02625 [Magnetococcales bacterium]|nr:hypothetical protein [Magnetococcales bacterium]
MRQWGLQSMHSKGSTFLAMAGAMALVVGTAACGGGGGSTTAAVTSTTVGGLASDGLLQVATVNVYSRDGTTPCTSTQTGSDGKYSLSVSSTCLPPLRIEVSGGTDKTTGKTNDLTLQSLVTNTSQTTANLSPQTTMMAYAMKAAAGGSLTAMAGKSATEQSQLVSTASTAVLKSFGFGADANASGFNPMTTPITTTTQITAFESAADAAGEVVRRLTSSLGTANTTNVAAAMQAIGQQMVGANNSTVTIAGRSLSISGLDALVSTQKAVVSAEVLTGSLTRNSVATGTMASAGTLATTSFLSSLSTAFQQQMQSDVKVAKSLGVFSTAMETAMNTALTAASTGGSASMTMPTGETLTTLNSNASGAVTNIDDKAGAALNAVNFRVQPSVTLMDFPLGTTASATVATMSQTVDSTGVMTANFPVALSASNLSNVGKSSGIAPIVNFTMANLDGTKGSGVAVVTATLVDGTNATRDAGERYISVSTSFNWTSNGTSIVLSAPSAGVAPVSYYTANSTASAPATATLTNGDLDVLSVTSSGTSPQATLSMKVAGLFSQLAATSLDANGTKGNYYYKVTVSGLPLSACNYTESLTSCSATTAKPFSTVQGTISAQ